MKTQPKSTILSILFWLGLTTIACSSLAELTTTGPATSSPTVAPSDTPAPIEPSPTPPPPRATATPQPPTATPTQAAAANIPPTPAVDFTDLSPYRQAMLSPFETDVDTVAAAGASHYYLDLTLAPESLESAAGLRLTGTQRVLYTNTEDVPLSEIYFRLYSNLFGGQIDIASTLVVNQQLVTPSLAADNSALRVPVPAPLAPGDTADITLFYNIKIPTSADTGYNILSYTSDTIALATVYPVIAVYDEAGWNLDIPIPYGDATYLDMSLFQAQLTVPQEMVVTASGSTLDSQPNPDGTKTVQVATGPMRDFYLAMRADFQVASRTVDGTVVNSYYPAELEEGGRLALQYAADALEVFNRRFGPYPYAEFDIVATPTTAGGVEYPGIVVVSQNIYNQEGGFFQHATAHEVAHQWWYGLVGNDQVNEPWLDESLTNYSTILYWEAVEGEEGAEFVLDTFFFGPYEQAKKQGIDRDVIGPVSEYTLGEYSTFVYGKGPLFFNALRQEVGDETYFKIMQTYYSTYKYKLATADNLFDTIEQVAGINVEPLQETWLQGP